MGKETKGPALPEETREIVRRAFGKVASIAIQAKRSPRASEETLSAGSRGGENIMAMQQFEVHGAGGTVEQRARYILEKKIADGQASAAGLMERVLAQVPKDYVAKAEKMTFDSTDGFKLVLPPSANTAPLAIHRHARRQIAERAGVPGAFLEELTSGVDWQRACAADILERHFINAIPNDRALVRVVDDQVRGFLSDRFRRLDSRPLMDAFAGACQKAGAVPIEGTASDVRVAMKAIIPRVYTPIPGEAVALGVEWGNSDFGAARHSARLFIFRLWCLNGATTEDALAQVHLGGRLHDDVEYSDRTFRLDTAASVSALKDMVGGLLGERKIEATLGAIRAAADQQITWASLKTKIGKSLFAAEVKAVEQAWKTEDVAILPAGETTWRASNVLSWIARTTPDPDRKLELERLAGKVLNGRDDAAS